MQKKNHQPVGLLFGMINHFKKSLPETFSNIPRTIQFIIQCKKWLSTSAFLFTLFLSIASKSSAQQFCNPAIIYDQITSAYHTSFARLADGSFVIWGEQAGPTTTNSDLLLPTMVTPANGFTYTGSPLYMAIASTWEEPQVILLSTGGLYVWGTEDMVVPTALTTNDAFQKITPTGANTYGLPGTLTPTDIKFMTASHQILAIQTNAGDVYTLGSRFQAYGDGTTTTNSAWHRVMINSTTPLTNVAHMRITYKGGFAITSSNTWYTWGDESLLGNGGGSLDRRYATSMTVHGDFTSAAQVKMIQVGSKNTTSDLMAYYILHTNGMIYVLGENTTGQLGVGSNTDQLTWKNVIEPGAGTSPLTNIKQISANESDDHYGAAGAVTTSGIVYTWGDNSYAMIGHNQALANVNRPTIPNGFTVGTDIANFVEVGGHSTIIVKAGSSRYCYIGHRVFGSMGDGTSIDDVETDFNCTNTGVISVCAVTSFDAGDVPLVYENGNNATHTLITPLTLRLGATFPTANNNNIVNVAAGADNNGANGDGTEEDGVTNLLPYTNNGSYNLTVSATNTTGSTANVYAWIDWNNDGQFSSSEFRSLTANTGGTTNLTFSWSGLPISGLNSKIYVRIRTTTQNLTDNGATSGVDERSIGAANNGEVEDYQLSVNNIVSGSVWNDINGSVTIDGTESSFLSFPSGFFVNLLNASNAIVGSAAIPAGGTFSLSIPQSVNGYKLVLTTSAASTTPALPSTWINTGENVGSSNTAAQGSTLGLIELNSGTSNITAQNFGIEQIPVAGSGSQTSNNPGGSTQITVNANTFTNTTLSSDPSPGAVTAIRITSFPSNNTSIVINGTSYTLGTFPVGGVIVPTDANGNPPQSITVDPNITGSGNVTISFVARDAAGRESNNTGTAVINVNIDINGTVFNDINGLSDNIINNGVYTNGGLNAVLVNTSTNTVVATSAVLSTGTYSFTGLSNGNYSVRITTSVATIGAAPPAVALLIGWVPVAENLGTSAGSDGTPDGILNLGSVTANLSNARFGVEQRPTAGYGGQNAGANPGGTTQVAVSTGAFAGTAIASDPAPGAVTGMRITGFPTNTTSIVINGTSYTNATFPATGVIVPTDGSGNPTQTITIDPSFTGSGTVTISFVARDAAGIESSNFGSTGTAVISFTIDVSGNVLNDINGLSDNTVNNGAYTGGGLNAILVNTTTNTVTAITTVNAGGTYTFTGLTNANYAVRITTNAATIGAAPPAVVLLSGWVNTGENVGTAAGNDGTVDGILSLGAVSANIANANFGIEQRPTAGSGTQNAGTNPGGTTQVTVNASAFTTISGSTDPSPGTVTAIRITSFPFNTTSIVINGTTYTSATFPVAGVIIPTDASGNPTQSISIDPSITGSGSISIIFVARDAAGIESINAGIATINFTIGVSGNVYNDIDGLSDNTVDNGAYTAGGLNAVLVNSSTNLVSAVTTVGAGGTYIFTGISNGTYSVRITTNTTTVGSAPPAVALPAGWVNTGENIGITAGSDGTVDGIISLGTISANTVNVNFGIEERPTAGSGTFNAGVNPGGTAQATVNTTAFTATSASTDPTPGAVTAIRITAFPTNTTTIVINGTSYTNATFPGAGVIVPTDASGNPAQTITIDPSFSGSGNVVISFVARDAANVESSNTGNANISFSGLQIDGTVFNDINGLSDNTVNNSAYTAGGLNAVLINTTTNTVVATTTVSATGTYSFTNQSAGGYAVLITTNSATTGAAPPAVILPAGWVLTGENIGTAAGNDGTIDGILYPGNVSANISNVNFGIEQPPTIVGSGTQNANNPGGTTQVNLSANIFTNIAVSSDPAPGAITAIRITAFPANVTSMIINGTTYTSASFPGVGIVVPADASGNPILPISIDPSITGSGSVTISFVARDAARMESATTGNATINFTTTVSGNVYNDIDGLTDNTVNNSAYTAGGLNAVLVNTTTNTVTATTTVTAGGTYTFTGLADANYAVRITTSAATVGAAPPVVTLPSGWVNTGENVGTAAGNDGTVDGILSLGAVSGNINNANFGIEERPTAGAGTQNAGNPGGATQVNINASAFTNTTVSTDPAPGVVTAIRINTFPTNTTSIVIDGTSYTSATFPAGGVIIPTDANGNPTQTITIDPSLTGSGNVIISFAARDEADVESANTGTATITFTTSITGSVFNDVNGLTDNTVNGPVTNAGGLNVVLVNASGSTVIATTTVGVGGTYIFTGISNGTYSVRITTNTATVGSAPPAVALPAGWVNTGENIGITAGSDGTVDGIISLGTISANTVNVNFGIEERPTAGSGTFNAGVNPGGTAQATVNTTAFTATSASTDPTPGAVTAIRITAFPTNTTTIVINGTSYTNATFPGAGVIVPTDASGNPAQTITIDPSFSGSGNVVISFVARDAANVESSNTGNANISFSGLQIDGTVFNDINGLSDNTVNNSAYTAGGLNAVLINTTTNTVVATTTVSATGTYSFTNQSAGGYAVLITTNSATTGAAPPAVILPAGWVLTGENIGTAAGNDGTIDGILYPGNVSANISNVNFGIEQPPTIVGSGTQNANNPGGTTQVNLSANIFTNIAVSSDPAPGAITAIRITAFPANVTSMIINGTTYTSASFPGVGIVVPADASGNPILPISIDPSITGSGSVTISFVARDAARMESATTGNATINFTTTVSGNVYNDIDGLTDNTVNNSAYTAGGLNAVLVNTTTNTVTATTTVTAGGTYTFTGLADANYAVRITTSAATVGAAPPVVTLPSGWVNTGENVGTAAGNDGTVDGILSLGAVSGNINNANFGIEERPTAGAGTQNAGNPGGATQVNINASAFTNTTVSTDPAPGVVTAIRINTFPTNTTSIVIDGTSYTSATFPAGGVIIPTDANGNPTQTITIDPSLTGSGNVIISFVARDEADVESANTGTATINFTFSIAGNIFNDINGLADNTVNGTNVNPGNTLNAILVNNTTGFVVASTVATSGTYVFNNISNGNYSVRITTNAATIGSLPPAVLLPSAWTMTGENVGIGAGNDGLANSIINIGAISSLITNINFGIEQPPTAGNGTYNAGLNPGGTAQVTVSAAAFNNALASSDPSPGSVTDIRIIAFPTNTTTIVINGTSYTNATFPVAGVVVSSNTSGSPTQTITVDPSIAGSGTITISFVARDAAGKESANTGTASISFNTSIAGKIFNDVNGLSDNTLNGPLVNPSNSINAVLVSNTTGLVVASTLASGGAYTFNGIINDNYYVLITTNTAVVGAAPPAVSLPAGWSAIGEYNGTGAGSDGTVNGILNLGLISAIVTEANFGIEQPPSTVGSGIQSSTDNPGGTTQVTVNASTFTNTTVSSDAAPGGVTAIRITSFPASTTSLVVNGVTYINSTFPVAGINIPSDANGNPSQTITIDPSFSGTGSISISFKAVDAAGLESSGTGTATLNFTVTVTGNVYLDADGLTNNTVDGTGTNAGNTLKVVLINSLTNRVVTSATVNSSGTYSIPGITLGFYSLRLTTANATAGSIPPLATLPVLWVNTGEKLGPGTGSDGTPDGSLSIGFINNRLTNANFGIFNCSAGTGSPVATAASDKAVYCSQSGASPIQLSGSATGGFSPYTYAWTGSGLSDANTQNPVATPSTSGSYTVTVTDALGCKGTNTTSVVTYDNTLPSIAWTCGSSPNNWLRLMENNGASWYWTTTSGGRFYTSSNYSVADDDITSNLRMPYINKAGEYTVQITSVNGCITTGSLTLSPTPSSCSIVLPDESIDLYSNWSGNNIVLKWNTAIPNVASFTIERSVDAINFTAIGEIKSTDAATYNYTDTRIPSPCTSIWYRIRVKDIHGKEVLSKANIITCKQLPDGSLLVMPNPVTNGSFTLNYKIPVTGTVNYELFSLSGNRVATGVIENIRPNETGSKRITLPATTARGTYILKLSNMTWAAKPLKIVVAN